MNVKKIVVDELPNGYKNKKSVVEIEMYLNYVDGNTTITEYYHEFTDDPLVVEDECVWEVGTANFGGMVIVVGHPACGWKDISDMLLSQYIFCPNCGKRIVYKESEEE